MLTEEAAERHGAPSMELPKYRCHKEVWALKVSGVEVGSNGTWLSFDDARYARRQVSQAYDKKHTPKPGGYFVVYANGYESWSPGDVFESGYTLIPRAKLSE